MQKCFAYLRVSGKAQVAGDGFPRQRAAIKGHAKANGYLIVREFVDKGVSGAIETTDRPAFAEMLKALFSNGVRVVMVEKLDRLARDLMVQEACIADMRKNGFTLISVAEPDLMATDATRVLMRQLLGAVAQYDKTQIVAKLAGARLRKRAETGRCEGAKPYGTFPGEAEVIKRIKSLHASGLGFDRVAVALNAEGVKPRRGVRWYGSTINNILSATPAA